MPVTEKDVQKAATLAKIRLDDSQMKTMQGELDTILKWISTLKHVNVDGVEPMTSPLNPEMPERQDKITRTNQQQEILANAPNSEDGFFVVPKAME